MFLCLTSSNIAATYFSVTLFLLASSNFASCISEGSVRLDQSTPPNRRRKTTKIRGRTKNSRTQTPSSYLCRGWHRTAYTKLENGGWMQTTVRRDNKFVQLFNTVYIVAGCEVCTRWERQRREYLTVPTRLVHKMYQKHMGHVDRVDKNVALSDIRLRHCSRQYHRSFFL